jgi:hypothetical protein
MIMKKNLNEELKDIKYLFNYDRGRVISEQNMFDDDQEEFDTSMDDEDIEEFDTSMDYDDDQEEFDRLNQKYGAEAALMGIDPREVESMYSQRERNVSDRDIDMELDEEMDLPVMLPGTKEKERIKVDPGTKPKKPKTPYSPKPGPKPDPKARKRKGDMPTWLTFDELGIDFE